MVGAPTADPVGGASGIAYVVFGPLATTAGSTFDLGSADIVIQGAAAGDKLGQTACSGGDVDGDGEDDLLVGALNADSSGGDSNVGKVYVFYGALPTGTVGASSADVTLSGEAASDQTVRLGGPGDVNGDGVDDVFIGSAGNDAAGAAYLFLGLGQ